MADAYRVAAGNAPDTVYTAVAGRIRTAAGIRAVDVAVPHDGSLCEEELQDAALQMLSAVFPGCTWADPRQPHTPIGPNPAQRRRLMRLVAYFTLFVAVFPALMVAISWALRENVFEPACRTWGSPRGLSLLGFTGHGGDWLGPTPLFAASCNFGGAHNQVAFSAIAPAAARTLETFSGVIVVIGGTLGTLAAVLLIALVVERLVRDPGA